MPPPVAGSGRRRPGCWRPGPIPWRSAGRCPRCRCGSPSPSRCRSSWNRATSRRAASSASRRPSRRDDTISPAPIGPAPATRSDPPGPPRARSDPTRPRPARAGPAHPHPCHPWFKDPTRPAKAATGRARGSVATRCDAPCSPQRPRPDVVPAEPGGLDPPVGEDRPHRPAQRVDRLLGRMLRVRRRVQNLPVPTPHAGTSGSYRSGTGTAGGPTGPAPAAARPAGLRPGPGPPAPDATASTR